MATGPEHYRQAERLLTPEIDPWGAPIAVSEYAIAKAQVHATLALAAFEAAELGPAILPEEFDPGTWEG